MKFDKHIFWLRLMHNTERLKEDELIEHNVQNGVSTAFVWWSMMSESGPQIANHIFSNFIFTFITGYRYHVKHILFISINYLGWLENDAGWLIFLNLLNINYYVVLSWSMDFYTNAVHKYKSMVEEQWFYMTLLSRN